MKIGVLGGSFDPIHMGHLLLAEQARSEYHLDKVIFMPAKLPPHKLEKTMTDVRDRYHMTELATEDNEAFLVSDLELKREGTSYTVDTIHELKRIYPDVEIFFIAGADSIFQLETWMTFEELLQMVTFLGAIRPGFNEEALKEKIDFLNRTYEADVRGVHFPMIDISSTTVRNLLLEGKSVRYLIRDEVYDYIKERGLYEEKRSTSTG